jgi:hypothetical protein
MQKIIYLVNGSANESYGQFKSRVFEAVNQLKKAENPFALKVVLTEFLPPALSVIPFRKKKIACISVYQDYRNVSGSISELTGLSGVYSVTEALPVVYEQSWQDGEPTPGVCLFTLFRQKKGISYEAFIDRWHNSHTPLSLRLHPLWNYSRNVVVKRLTEDSTSWDGIVEEHVRTKSDLLNPFKFFGKPMVILPNMLKVYTDTNAFLDYKTIETYLAMEYIVVSRKS